MTNKSENQFEPTKTFKVGFVREVGMGIAMFLFIICEVLMILSLFR